ncbi:hypothetical protein GCM10022223_46880 [Kineosporia mesophila]|uniref:Uncharacterized protein n=2 Tax=Kineosporia mesophila TaxID=566012 RepID=A0ABP7A3Y3_9ACTN
MAKETFRALLECRHVIIVDTDLPMQFWCPTCKQTRDVLINSQVKSDHPIHRLPRRFGR